MAVDGEVFADAPAGLPEHAHGMGFIDHEQGLVAFFDFDEIGQIGDVAVHAVDAFDDDEHAAILMAELGEEAIGLLPIVVCKRPASGAGKDGSFDDAVVGQCVVEDQVAGSEKVPDHGFIGGMTAGEGQGVFGSQEIGDCIFQFHVDCFLAGDEAAGGDAGAEAVDGLFGGGGNGGVAGHAEVVIASETDDVPAIDEGAIVGNSLVHGKERISQTGVVHEVQILAELEILGEFLDAVE